MDSGSTKVWRDSNPFGGCEQGHVRDAGGAVGRAVRRHRGVHRADGERGQRGAAVVGGGALAALPPGEG
eukprot:3784302-Pyramimonas_sp.AAC.2